MVKVLAVSVDRLVRAVAAESSVTPAVPEECRASTSLVKTAEARAGALKVAVVNRMETETAPVSPDRKFEAKIKIRDRSG